VERAPHGRHTAGQSWQACASARTRKRTKTARGTWVAVLGSATALMAAALTFAGGGKQFIQFAAGNGNAPLLGASVASMASLKSETAQFGRLGIVRTYYTGLPAANAWTTGLPAANHSAAIVSFKAQPSAILSGADDATLSHFFDTAPTGHPIYYVYYHEPEDNIAAGQFTAADYKAAWAHVVKLANAAHNPWLHSTLVLMNWDLEKGSGRNWKDYLPGGGIISTLGWDAYPVGSAVNNNPQPTPPAQFMGPCIAASKSVGLPFGFAEFGLSTATGRPAWMTSVGNYLMSSGALFGSLWNGDAEFPTLKLTDPGSIAVWKSFVARSGTGPAPGPSPTPTDTATPTPAPSGSTPPPPASAGPSVSGLAVSPAALTSAGQNHVTISFSISQAADVTVVVLDSKGNVVRTLIRPTHGAGKLTIPYYGYNGGGQRVAPGSYNVLVVASNSGGSGTAETPLTISAP
jgi:FlgD Ig-like domain